MSELLLAGAESLFLDKLPLVVGHPLAYVAFIILVLAWVWRAYFLRTRKHLERLPQLPDADKLTALQVLVLGFPKTLTKNHLKVFQLRYKFVAFNADPYVESVRQSFLKFWEEHVQAVGG